MNYIAPDSGSNLGLFALLTKEKPWCDGKISSTPPLTYSEAQENVP